MTRAFTTDNIDNLGARRLAGGLLEVTFQSANEGLHHQLYVNGRLAECTETVEQRRFVLAGRELPCRLVVVAVDGDHRHVDMSIADRQAIGRSPWVFRTHVVRGPWHSRRDRVALVDDAAGGQVILVAREVWPAWADRRGWGEDDFALVGFGYDTASAPGLGIGAFAAGPFGLDGELVALEAAVPTEGLHRLTVRTIKPDGRFTDGEPLEFASRPPPPPLQSIMPVAYDAQSQTLTLELKRG